MKSLLLTGALLLLVLSFQAGADNMFDDNMFSDPYKSADYTDHAAQTLEDLKRQQEQDIYTQQSTDADTGRRMYNNYCNGITGNDRAAQACYDSQW